MVITGLKYEITRNRSQHQLNYKVKNILSHNSKSINFVEAARILQTIEYGLKTFLNSEFDKDNKIYIVCFYRMIYKAENRKLSDNNFPPLPRQYINLTPSNPEFYKMKRKCSKNISDMKLFFLPMFFEARAVTNNFENINYNSTNILRTRNVTISILSDGDITCNKVNFPV